MRAKQCATAGTTTKHATAFHPLKSVEPHLGRRDYTSVLGWSMESIVVRTTKKATISLREDFNRFPDHFLFFRFPDHFLFLRFSIKI